MDKKYKNVRTLAWTLGIFLVIALGFLVQAELQLKSNKAEMGQNITAQQDVIRTDCSAKDPDSQARCADDLQKLSDLLAQFTKTIHPAASTGVQGAVNNVQIDKLPKQ